MYGQTDPDQQRRALTDELTKLDNPTSAVLFQRLARAHPLHVARIARGLFLTLTAACVLTLILSLTLPHLGSVPRAMLYDIERALPIHLPVLAGILALCMLVAWVTSGQAALSIARDCPNLPWEEEIRRKVTGQLELLGVNAGYVGFQDDSSSQSLHMPDSSLANHGQPQARGYDAQAISGPEHGSKTALDRLTDTPQVTPGGTLAYNTSKQPGALGDVTGGRGFPTPMDVIRGTPEGASSYPNRHAASPPPTAYSPPPSAATPPGLSYRSPGRQGSAPVNSRATDPAAYARSHHGGYTISPHSSAPNPEAAQPASWNMPDWSEIQEPWLQDALTKAEGLTRRYPVQAFLEFSVEPDLPFTLVLERATPAMAVRAMVDYVGFIASIATPRKARIELRSVVHLDRSFYRSVMSAMEPYFPDSVEIRQQGYRVEIDFLEPDPGWARFPLLPMD